MYDTKNINISLVKPPRYEKFDDMILPFFNNYENDIAIEYGDITNNCIIHVLHGRKKIKINENIRNALGIIDCFSISFCKCVQ